MERREEGEEGEKSKGDIGAYTEWSFTWLFISGQTLQSLSWITRLQISESTSSLEKEMATHSSILTWKIPWTEEPGGLQSTGLFLEVAKNFAFQVQSKTKASV